MLVKLHRIAELDEEIAAIRRRPDPYRARLENVKKIAAASRELLDRLSQALTHDKKKLRTLEIDLQALVDRHRAELKKLDAVTSSRAATAAEHELESLKSRQNVLEEEMLSLMEQVEKGEAALKGAQEEAERANLEAASLAAEIEECERGCAEKAAILEVERDGALSEIEPDLQKKYAALTAKGIASPLTRADSGACMKCQAALKPNVTSRLSAHLPAVCENCKRIILPN